MPDADERRGNSWERHAQTIIGAILIGLVAWTGLSVTKTLEATARMDERILNLGGQINEIKNAMTVWYSKSEAENEFKRVYKDIDELKGRVKNIERK